MLAHLPRVPQLGDLGNETKENKTAARLTVSLPIDIADYLRSRAEQLQEPVSGIVAETLRWRQQAELEKAMIDGLLEDAERDRALVAEWSVTLPEE